LLKSRLHTPIFLAKAPLYVVSIHGIHGFNPKFWRKGMPGHCSQTKEDLGTLLRHKSTKKYGESMAPLMVSLLTFAMAKQKKQLVGWLNIPIYI
jgi:hypothetical protein